MAIIKDSKSQILANIDRILTEQSQPGSKVATKEEEAQLVKNKEIVTKAANYTVDTIVKGMADLQLDFGSIIAGLSDKLTLEVEKLTEAKQAIEIETEHRAKLKQIRVVADALHIITQEHQESLKSLEQKVINHQEQLDKEQTNLRKKWAERNREYLERQTDLAANLAKDRQKEQDESEYKLLRDRQLEVDKFAELKRTQEQELQVIDRTNKKQWKEREKFLSDNKKLLEENLVKVAAFPTELEESVKKAREEAIKETSSDAKVRADLFEKEWEGNKQSYEAKIQSLEQVIERQTIQNTAITEQLQAVMNQAQSLAMKAFETSARQSN